MVRLWNIRNVDNRISSKRLSQLNIHSLWRLCGIGFGNIYGMMIFLNWILVLHLKVCLAEIERYKSTEYNKIDILITIVWFGAFWDSFGTNW